MKIPNAGSALIDLNKLQGYCLNAEHPRGKHKAKLFAAILGLTAADAEELREILLRAIAQYEAEPQPPDQYGQRYILNFPLTHNNQTATIRSVWIIRPTETFPRLVSCYIIR